MTLERDYILAGLTLLGIVLGATLTGLWGWIIAKRKGLDSITLAEINDRATFRTALLERVRGLEDENDELRKEIWELKAKNREHGWNDDEIGASDD